MFRELKEAQRLASSGLGQMIHLAYKIFSSEALKAMEETVAVDVSQILDHSLPRLTETYSIWLCATLKVHKHSCLHNKHSVYEYIYYITCRLQKWWASLAPPSWNTLKDSKLKTIANYQSGEDDNTSCIERG